MSPMSPMSLRAVSLAFVSLVSLSLGACKKTPPAGDLPPTTAPPAPAGDTANPHGDVANPHGDMANPHGDMAGPPHASVPSATGPKTLDPLPDGRLALGPFALALPKDWTTKPVTSSMRAADLVLPAKPGAEAELIVYYFGAQGAGSVDDNLDRWLGQFDQPDGKKSRDVAKIEKTKFAGQTATYVSVAGHFAAEAMPGTGAVDKPNQALLAAIVDSPSGPYYFKLVGAKPTVDAQTAAFRGMLDSLKLR
jgi:hypothetical protein